MHVWRGVDFNKKIVDVTPQDNLSMNDYANYFLERYH